MNLFNKLVNWYFKKDALPYWCIFLSDCLICFVSGVFVFWMFFRGETTLAHLGSITNTLLLYMVFNVIGFRIFHTYAGIIRYSSFLDLLHVAYAMIFAFACVAIIHYPIIFWEGNRWIVPLGLRHIIPIYIVSTIFMWGFRVVVKIIHDTLFDNERAEQTLIYGINEGGIGIAKSISNQKPQKFKLFGFIAQDNDPRGQYLMGKKVYHASLSLRDVIKENGIKNVLVSPLRNDEFRNDGELQDLLLDTGVKIFMTEGVREWNNDLANEIAGSLKEISVEDLLPRDQINIDMDSVGENLKDRKILITGSAGSIGSEIIRQVCVFHPAELMLIDQAETPQHDIRLMMAHDYPDIKVSTVVASIENEERMEKIFSEFRPDYIFHAAAYKHVPMMENNPSESIQTNVHGTKIIADLSVKYRVKKFVMLSTDKAVNPTNVMGCSKRICEMYIQSLDKAQKEGKVDGITRFVTTRFGNVLGSNGSVIPIFKKQIKEGGPVTVTDPNIVRFFMLIPEACKLVLEAGTKSKGGEIFVFDMGKPVKIKDLAQRMISLSGARNVEIIYTGLRAGEKLYEEVLNDKENTLPSFNSKIRIARVREYDYFDVDKKIENLIAVSHSYDDMGIVAEMKKIVPEYKSKNTIYTQLDKN